jgi:hypothetical protein
LVQVIARFAKKYREEKEAKVDRGLAVVSSLHKPIDTQSERAHTLATST